MYRDSYLHIDLDILTSNLEILEEVWGDKEILAVLKDNAYGHGALTMVRALEEEGISYFAVAYLNEALELARVSESPILILTPTPLQYLETLINQGFIQSVGSFKDGTNLIETGRKLGKKARAEIKIDTGFHRFGFEASSASIDEIVELHHRGLDIIGVYSHLSLSSYEDDLSQYNCLMDFAKKLRARGLDFKLHLADSIASVDNPLFQLDMIRPGALLYGMVSFKKKLDIVPIASLRTKICHLLKVRKGEGLGYDYTWRPERNSLVAQLPLGYGDGYPRDLGNKGYVIIRGQRAPIVGIICMDVISVDVTDIEGVELGDEVLAFGSGKLGEMTLASMASLIRTNKNEILAGLQARLPRLYTRGNRYLHVDEKLGETKGDLFREREGGS